MPRNTTAGSAAISIALPKAAELSEFLSVSEVAAYLRIAPSTMYDLLRQGRMPSVRVGRTIRVRRTALIAWVEEQERVTGWYRATP